MSARLGLVVLAGSCSCVLAVSTLLHHNRLVWVA